MAKTFEQASSEMLYVLNENFVPFYNISEFTSLIWTERYWEYSEFELEIIYDVDVINNVKVGNYLALGDSSNIMIIESISISYEIEDKASRYIVYKGKSLECLLERRIVWEGEWLYENTDAQDIIIGLITNAIVKPKDNNRKVGFFTTKKNPDIPKMVLTLMGDGDNIYEIVRSICQEKQIGMRCSLNENSGLVEFSLYVGLDRSYDQMVNPPVIFSAEYENLGPSRYTFDTSNYKTAALVVSPWRDTEEKDDEGNIIESDTTRSVLEVGDFSIKGINRREIFVESGSGYPDDMVQEAMEEIADANRLEELDSELDPKRQFAYNEHYTIGDTVQVITEFGLDAKAIVIEFIRSWDENGYTEVPTFKILDGNLHRLTS